MRIRLALLVVCFSVALGALAPTAFGQSATEDNYTPLAGQQADPGDPTVRSSDGGSLPFTGLEAGLVALAGAALLGTGLLVRRASRSEPGIS